MRAILEATAQLLETGGSDAATTDHIAQRAGVSIGSLYQYFPSRKAIVLALAQCHVLETALVLGSALADLERVPPLEGVLRRGVRALLEIHVRRPRLHRALFEETVFRAEDLTKLEAAEGILVERLARYLERAPDADATSRRGWPARRSSPSSTASRSPRPRATRPRSARARSFACSNATSEVE